MSTLTIELADRTERRLKQQASELGLSVGELIEAMTDQLSDGKTDRLDLNGDQIAEIKRSMDDLSPASSHDDVMIEMDRLLDGRE